jgi:hypothetical protein
LRAPIRLDGALAAEAVAEVLAPKLSELDGELLPVLGRVTGETKALPVERWAPAINARLKRAAGSGTRRSLLVLDEDHAANADVVWAALVDHLGRLLPELRLVRLTAPVEKIEEHTLLAAPIEDTYARRAAAEGDHDEHHDG